MTLRWLTAVLAGAFALFASPAVAGKQLGAVTGEIFTDHGQVVACEVLDKLDENRIRIRIGSRFHGDESAATVEVLVGDATWAAIEEGGRYLIAYSSVRKNPRLRAVVERDPRGAVVIKTTLVGDFVLADRPASRRLVAGAAGKGSKRAQAKAALELIAGDDVAATRFAAMELYGREDLRNAVATRMTEAWAATLVSGAVDAEAQDFLFRAGRRIEGHRPWLAEGARDVLGGLDMPLDPISPLPSLAVTVMDALSETGTAEDAGLIERFVASRNPGVAKAALRSMDRLDRAYTLARANRWLRVGRLGEQPLLEEVMSTLRGYVTRHEE